jgi:hypothetical protein
MNNSSEQNNTPSAPKPDEATQRAPDEGDADKIDHMLEQLHVSTTDSGQDQSDKPDTEGSGSSSKNLDEQGE